MLGSCVCYYRVSTSKQAASGLGLEAQESAVTSYLESRDWRSEGAFTEVETGKGAAALEKRPQLRAALALAKRKRPTLVIAKLDRLARDVHFISGLQVSGVDFVAVDNPHASKAMVQMMAVFAEMERDAISARTIAALAAAKARGTRLGRHGAVLAAQYRAEAVDRLAPFAERLRTLQSEGLSLARSAAIMNAEGLCSPGGGRWHAATVQRAFNRLDVAHRAT